MNQGSVTALIELPIPEAWGVGNGMQISSFLICPQRARPLKTIPFKVISGSPSPGRPGKSNA